MSTWTYFIKSKNVFNDGTATNASMSAETFTATDPPSGTLSQHEADLQFIPTFLAAASATGAIASNVASQTCEIFNQTGDVALFLEVTPPAS